MPTTPEQRQRENEPQEREAQREAPFEPSSDPRDPVTRLLARPRDQRTREYKYRFAQSIIFGLPVLALTLFGTSLGGRDAGRWINIFSLLLTGWVVYVGVTGMLFEGMILLAHRRLTTDLFVALLAITAFTIGLIRTVSDIRSPTPWFAITIVLIDGWSAFQWWRHNR